MAGMPEGTVTLLFTDIEGSTGLVRELGDDYPAALEEHRRNVRSALHAAGGEEIDARGDEFSAAFSDAESAVAAARAIASSCAAKLVSSRCSSSATSL